jgi:alpha-glucan, water dikinase
VCCVQIHLPQELAAAVSTAAMGLSSSPDPSPPHASEDARLIFSAIKRVWASKWNARALRAAVQTGTTLDSLHMSVLLQPLVDTSVAFVAHTRDPRAPEGSEARMLIEAVVGLGESLVSNVSGQALAFSVDIAQLLAAAPTAGAPPLACLQGASGNASTVLHEWVHGWPESVLTAALGTLHIECAPSKSWSVHPVATEGFNHGLIARSASNMEDLVDYAGAGVFDSVTTRGISYSPAQTGALGGSFRKVGVHLLVMAIATAEVATRLGGQQDVEGVLDESGAVFVVQARPQV